MGFARALEALRRVTGSDPESAPCVASGISK